MKKTDVLIIGGGPAGITAAISAKRSYPGKSVMVVRQEKQVMIPCGIPYIFGTLANSEQNLIPDASLTKNQIDIMIAKVEKIDAIKKIVLTSEGQIEWDRLVVATGSVPFTPPIPGKDLPGVFDIRKDADYLKTLKSRVEEARNIVIVGGGFIGVEFADEISKNSGKNVSIVELMPNCLSLSYDAEFCCDAENRLREKGIKIYTSTKVLSFNGGEKVESVKISTGEELAADVVILGIGASSNVSLAAAAGLVLGKSRAIAVDRRMETSVPGIFACGDCTEKVSFFGGKPSGLKLASIATQEARIAGANLFETRREGVGAVGVWSTVVGGMALGTAGLTESAAAALGYKAVATYIEGVNRHPGVMPGGVLTKLKLVFDASSGVLLGGQAVGGESVGDMINVVAALLQKNMRADEIVLFQMGTHPALTSSPIVYHLVNAAEIACQKMLK